MKLTEKKLQQLNYIKTNCADMPVWKIAQNLKISTSTVNRALKYMRIKKRKLYACEYSGQLNPYPVTATTKMLVCRYYYEGMSIHRIAGILCRTEETVRRILCECIADGNYYGFNIYGRFGETFPDKSLKTKLVQMKKQ